MSDSTDAPKVSPHGASEPAATHCLAWRQRFANHEFLLKHLYNCDHSKFLGSTRRFLVSVQLPESRQVIDELLHSGDSGSQLDAEVNRAVRLHIERLPNEIATTVQLPADVPDSQATEEFRTRGRQAIAHSLRAKTRYAELFAALNRCCRRHGIRPEPAREDEAWTLLQDYHSRGVESARRRFPEVWDVPRGNFVFDSRGMQFARELIEALRQRGELSSHHRFLDVGSGIGSTAAAVAMLSPATSNGIELHPGLARMARSLSRRLERKGGVDGSRLNLFQGDVLDNRQVNLSDYDFLYLYAAWGANEIAVDSVVARMRPGALLVTARLPTKHLDSVQLEARVMDLFAMRRC